jgi:hypothetical protein
LHVVPNGNSWAVRPEGSSHSLGNSSTQAGAQAIARGIAQAISGEVFIHRPNGQIRDRDSYGNDPTFSRG